MAPSRLNGYLRHPLSARQVAELLAERGVDVSARTVLTWVQTFGPPIAKESDRYRRRLGGRWYVEKLFLCRGGNKHYPGCIQTEDGQAALSFVPGAFVTPADRSPIAIDFKPVAEFPDPDGTHLSTNVYCITSSSPLAPGKEVLVTLQFSDQLPAPSDIYEYQGDGPWQKIGSTGTAAPFYIAARATYLGCFAGGYPANANQSAQGARLGGGQALPIIVAVAIVVVLLAGVPLAVTRRRGEAREEEEAER